MAQLNLKPGWLSRDVSKASQSASELRSQRQQTFAVAKKKSEDSERENPVSYEEKEFPEPT